MPEAPENSQRALLLAGLESFVGTIAFQYGMIIAFLGWDAVTETEDPNRAAIAASKIMAVSFGVTMVAVYRRWVMMKPGPLVRLGLIPLSGLVAGNSVWLVTSVIYPHYRITEMASELWYFAIPCLLGAAALLPLRYGVTACGLGGTFATMFFGMGSRAFSYAYSEIGPLMGSLFGILCLGSVGGTTLKQRLVQHAGNALNGICLVVAHQFHSSTHTAGTPLAGLFVILGTLLMIGLPLLVERFRVLGSREG